MTQRHQKEQIGKTLEWQIADSSSPPSLRKNQLHLWFVTLSLDGEQQENAVALLNDTQRDKYHRRATPALKESYLAGRYHLMNILGAYNRVSAQEVKLSYSRLNKPYLNPNPSDIQFNFTDTVIDSSGVALLAFARFKAVGVDIESLTRRSNFSAIVKKRFSVAETNYVTQDDGSIDARRFLAYWTRKEAYGKATGRGINFKMNEMDLASPNSFDLKFEDRDQPAQPFSLQQIQIGDDLISSVVHQGHQNIEIKGFNIA
ncbi:MAG: 4'-phosphopantetheinyl transferase [Arenicella sp.]